MPAPDSGLEGDFALYTDTGDSRFIVPRVRKRQAHPAPSAASAIHRGPEFTQSIQVYYVE